MILEHIFPIIKHPLAWYTVAIISRDNTLFVLRTSNILNSIHEREAVHHTSIYIDIFPNYKCDILYCYVPIYFLFHLIVSLSTKRKSLNWSANSSPFTKLHHSLLQMWLPPLDSITNQHKSFLHLYITFSKVPSNSIFISEPTPPLISSTIFVFVFKCTFVGV